MAKLHRSFISFALLLGSWGAAPSDAHAADVFDMARSMTLGAGRGLYGWSHQLVADVDGDGKDDLIALHTTNGGSAYVLRGHATKGFDFDARWYEGKMTLYGWKRFLAGDVNGDGRADLVAVHPTDGIYVVPGTAAGRFDSGARRYAPKQAYHAWPHQFLADVGGDGRADLVTLDASGNTYVVPGRADGSFDHAARVYLPADATRTGRAHFVVDIEGDGTGDLVTLASNGKLNLLFGGGARGGFDTGCPQAGLPGFPTPSGLVAELAGDVDGDRVADRVLITQSGTRLSVSVSRAAAPARTEGAQLTPFPARRLLLADVDGDGRDDLVGTTDAGGGTGWVVKSVLAAPPERFFRIQSLATGKSLAVAPGSDAVIQTSGGGAGTVWLYRMDERRRQRLFHHVTRRALQIRHNSPAPHPMQVTRICHDYNGRTTIAPMFDPAAPGGPLQLVTGGATPPFLVRTAPNDSVVSVPRTNAPCESDLFTKGCKVPPGADRTFYWTLVPVAAP